MSSQLTTLQKLRYPVTFGGLLLGIYVTFANRHRLLGDLTAEREIFFQDDKEARALGEEAIRAARKS